MGRLAAEPVTVELLKSKCLPSLYYGLEACPLSPADFKSLEYIVVGAFMKIFNTRSKEVATSCMEVDRIRSKLKHEIPHPLKFKVADFVRETIPWETARLRYQKNLSFLVCNDHTLRYEFRLP